MSDGRLGLEGRDELARCGGFAKIREGEGRVDCSSGKATIRGDTRDSPSCCGARPCSGKRRPRCPSSSSPSSRALVSVSLRRCRQPNLTSRRLAHFDRDLVSNPRFERWFRKALRYQSRNSNPKTSRILAPSAFHAGTRTPDTHTSIHKSPCLRPVSSRVPS